MPSHDRRAAGRQRAWGRGPIILKFESLEGRQLLSLSTVGSGIGLGSAETTTTGTNISSDPTSVATSISDALTGTSTNNTATLANTSATATTTAAGLPDLVAVRFMAQSNLDWDQTFNAQIGVMNQGTAATTKPFLIDVYASPSMKLSQGAVKIGSIQVPAGLNPGQTFQFERELTTPQVPVANLAQSPSYYLLLNVDANNDIAESDESNNVNRGFQGMDTSMVTITPRQPSDLRAAGLSVTPQALQWGGTLHVKATVLNNGQGNAPPTNARIMLAPANTNPFGPDGYSIGTVAMPAISGHQSVTAEQDITLPSEPPSTLANLSNFVITLVPDSDEVANPVVSPVQLQGQGIDQASLQITPKASTTPTAQLPDLAVTSIQNPTAVAWGETFTVTAKVQNDGPTAAGPFKVRFLLIQGNDQSAPTLALGDAQVPGLQAGYTQDIVQTIKLPAGVPAGLSSAIAQGRIVAVVNPDHALDESRLDNNTLLSTAVGLQGVGSTVDSTPVVTVLTPSTPTTPTPSNPQPQGSSQTPTTNPTAVTDARQAARLRRLAALEARRARMQLLLQQRLEQNQQRLRIYREPAGQQNPNISPALRILSMRAALQSRQSSSGKPA